MKLFLKILKWIGISIGSLIGFVVLFLMIINVSPFTFSRVKGKNEFRKQGKYPLVIPHGGAKELYPENTVYSYDELIKLGVDVLEIDLALTSDNILITHHDLDLEMNPNHIYNNQLIRTLTYQQIIDAYGDNVNNYYVARKFKGVDVDNEYPFATENDPLIMDKMVPAKMSDIFDLVGKDMLYILEIKDAPTAEGYDENIHDFELATQTLIDLIKLYELEEYVIIGSFEDDVIDYIKEHAPEIKVGAAMKEAINFVIYSAFYIDFFWGVKSEVMILPNPESMNIPEDLVGTISKLPKFIRKNIAIKNDSDVWVANLMGKQLINDAHRKNIAVYYWTVNDPDEMRLLIKNGADGIITDRPDILIKIIEELRGN